MLNVACCDAGCCSEEGACKGVVVFVSPWRTTVCGSFTVGPIGGGGVSFTVVGFMLVAVYIISNERAANVVQRGKRALECLNRSVLWLS